MALVMTRFAVLLVCSMTMLSNSVAEPSTTELFLGLYNGHFSNIIQVEANTGNHDLIQVRLQPVLVPKLQEEPALYIEEAVNGTIYRMAVGRLSESKDMNTVYVEFLYFTPNPSDYQPNTFDVEGLNNYEADDFKSYGPCFQAFKENEDTLFTGEWTDCKNTYNGTHPHYIITVHCRGISFLTTANAYEENDKVPYNLKIEGERFPLIGSDYVANCDREYE